MLRDFTALAKIPKLIYYIIQKFKCNEYEIVLKIYFTQLQRCQTLYTHKNNPRSRSIECFMSSFVLFKINWYSILKSQSSVVCVLFDETNFRLSTVCGGAWNKIKQKQCWFEKQRNFFSRLLQPVILLHVVRTIHKHLFIC